MNADGTKSIEQEIDRQAAEWFGRREVGLSAGQEQEFQRWLSADRRHAEHYRVFDETWDLLDDLKELKHSRVESPGNDSTNRSVLSRRLWISATLAAAATIAIAFVLWSRPNPELVSYAIATEAGAMKKLELPDGSVVRLNSDTAVRVDLTAHERRVSLHRGEAHFTVAKNPARPFIVSVAGVSVRAVGTAFNVALRPASLEVLVTEGRVRMEELAKGQSVLPGPIGSQPPVLQTGQKAVVALRAVGTAIPVATVIGVSPPETEQALAWQVKLLEFDMQPLSEMVAAFNRYNQHQLVIADAELARRVFGGTFRADNYEALVELLESRFGVSAERNGASTILRLHK